MNPTFRKSVSASLIFLMAQGPAYAAATDLASSPLVTSPSSSVLPNLMFILDDSGSMGWDFIPDWASGAATSLFKNVDYNGVAYDPSVTYKPPVYFTSGGVLDITTYPPMNGANTRGSCAADFCSVKDDGYGVQSTSSSDLRTSATYYTFVAGEYCTTANLRSCNEQAAANTTYPTPAVLRWCTTSTAANATPNPAATLCQASRVEAGVTYMNARYAGMKPPTANIVITAPGGATSSSVGSIKINGKEIMSAASSSSTSTSTLADNIVAKINCGTTISGNCTIAGYTAVRSGSTTVVITAPADVGNVSGVAAYTPVVATTTGNLTYAPAAFTGGLPGANIKVNIVSTTATYAYPNTTTRATSRTDCTGVTVPLTCTYAEEMTNYANWHAYYRTRMQMMKTSASIAFQPVDTKYRVGYMTINNNVTNGFLNLGIFDNTQKKSWYDKFFAAYPDNSTPLRSALTRAGRLYAGKLNGSTIAGVTVTEPLQYSCQQNFSLLTTDGYWNGAAGAQLDGTTALGNQDGLEPRPYNDGSNVITTNVTPSVTTVRKQTVQVVRRDTVSTRTVTTDGGSCSTTGVTPTSCVVDNGSNNVSGSGNFRRWCITTDTSGSFQCSSAIGSGGIYACRGASNSTNLPTSGSPTACKTDSSSENWCVYNNNTTGTACVKAVSGGNDIYACKPPAGVTGNLVTVEQQSSTFTETGATSTSVDDTATTNNTTVIITNGVAGSPQANTPANTVVTTNVPGMTSTTAYSSSSSTAYANTSSTGPTCVATASLPTFGTTTPVAGTPAVTPVGSATVTTLSTTGPTVGVTVTTATAPTGGTSNTLADVAQYYYATDLRTSALSNCSGVAGVDVCTNDVAGTGLDAASWQHMTTFTLGMANGVMQYSPTYQTQTSGDFFDVKSGTTANGTSVCGWQTSGACNWPTPVSNEQVTIDDLWHSAVNGRGVYFNATNPTALSAGLNSALAGVNARTGSSAAATTSNPNVTSGDNFVFSSTFTSNDWDGELIRQQLDLVTGVVSSTVDWSAQGQLDLLGYGSRVIYTRDTTDATNGRKLFTYANLTATEKTYFDAASITGLSQLCASGSTCLDTGIQAGAAGANLVNYLRGDRSDEGTTLQTNKRFRARLHVLGDIVNAEAVYVKTPLFNYGDTGFGAHLSAMASRQGIVYVAANDGMLHAFNSSTGAEDWTYVPTIVMPNLYKLADKSYGTTVARPHEYIVDGTPVSGEVHDGTAWRTIVVAGLNSGGRGYYALDVTNPASPKVLWEFTDTNMGFSYGNPIISKLKSGVLQSDGTTAVAGTWVVFATSGYNNNGTGQDGVGRLYIINAVTGALIRSISTGVGSTTTPSGLAKINAWVDDTASDNTTLRVYGGDMLGNLWRFDVNDNITPSGYEAQKLITLYANGDASTAGTVTQPITTKPELGDVSGVPVVYVGTGRYLGITDLTDTTKQSFYAVKDTLGAGAAPTTPIFGNPRDTSASGPKFVQQVATTTTCPVGSPTSICTTGQIVRTSTANTVAFATNNGWFIDLPGTGERANTDPTLALGTLGFTTNIPNTSACTAGGNSFRWLLDYKSGAPVSTSTTGVSSVSLGNALATRAVFVRLPNNTVVQLTRMSDGTTVTTNVPIGAGAASTRRVSWRELIQDQ